jgi:histidinol-phosphate aminotransferase
VTPKTARSVLDLIQPHIREMLGYEAIEPVEVLAERLGVQADKIVKLDGNENPYGPSPRVLEALGSFDQYHRYGDPHQGALRAAIGEYVGVDPEHVVAGHGGDELIDLLVRLTIGTDDAIIDCSPTFGMYDFSTRVQGGRIINVPRRDDFGVDVDAVRNKADAAKLVFVASPNNPTGNSLTEAELEGLLDTGLVVVADEAYAEFAGHSLATQVPHRENLAVLRTFSKWAGLAGLRAGYGILPLELAGAVRQIKPPFSPNAAAEVAMLTSLQDRDALLARVDEIVRERERLVKQLEALEFVETYSSEANFVLVRIAGCDGRALRDDLAAKGIFLRFFDQPTLQDCIRISVGTAKDTDRVIEALREHGGQRGR